MVKKLLFVYPYRLVFKNKAVIFTFAYFLPRSAANKKRAVFGRVYKYLI